MNGPELTLRIIIEAVVITVFFVAILFLISPDLAREIVSYTP